MLVLPYIIMFCLKCFLVVGFNICHLSESGYSGLKDKAGFFHPVHPFILTILIQIVAKASKCHLH